MPEQGEPVALPLSNPITCPIHNRICVKCWLPGHDDWACPDINHEFHRKVRDPKQNVQIHG